MVNTWIRDDKCDGELGSHGWLSSRASFSGDGRLGIRTAGGLVKVWDMHRETVCSTAQSAAVSNVIFLPGARRLV
jgi:hypothetical protein